MREQCRSADDETAYMGDDVIDLPPLARAGLACCPCDAIPEVQRACHLVVSLPGGRGAVRQLAEYLLQERRDGTWERALRRYWGLEDEGR
jgi:3-deoxy-D-manno-octulosonate 8-phosphate phosphatase (KDO 8-P phosphatase)